MLDVPALPAVRVPRAAGPQRIHLARNLAAKPLTAGDRIVSRPLRDPGGQYRSSAPGLRVVIAMTGC